MSKEYIEQAQAFLDKTGTTLEIKYIGNDYYFLDDKETRDIYRFTLTRGNKKYSAKFGQSIANSKVGYEKRIPPTVYDILACLDVCYYDNIDDFASEFGYGTANTKPSVIIRTWEEVQKQNAGLKQLFNEEELQQLQEIA